MKCIQCEFCKQIGKQQSQVLSIGRKTYYCGQPDVHKLIDKYG